MKAHIQLTRTPKTYFNLGLQPIKLYVTISQPIPRIGLWIPAPRISPRSSIGGVRAISAVSRPQPKCGVPMQSVSDHARSVKFGSSKVNRTQPKSGNSELSPIGTSNSQLTRTE